jgi:hypothetical protein
LDLSTNSYSSQVMLHVGMQKHMYIYA